jgi:hypothetical protein
MILSKTKKPSVSPRDCALLIGIPVDRANFIRKVEGPRDGNFTETFRASRTELSWIGYQPMAERLSNLAAEAESLGVRVFRSMTLEDLAAASRQGEVTIMSHSRSALFRAPDLVDIPRIRLALSAAHDGMPIPEDAAELANFLNTRFFPVRDQADKNLGAPIRFQMELSEVRRKLADELPGAFRGGAGVEFSDGFQPFHAIASQFPPTFTGVIDLIVCNSLLPAELLRNRCPRSLVIATSDLTFPVTRLPFYMATIRLLARGPRPYDDAVEELNRILRGEFK